MKALLNSITLNNQPANKSVVLIMFRLSIVIEYETSPSASALQWLTAQQTCGKKYPYLFSQGQVCILITVN